MRLKAKTRYRQAEQWATVYPSGTAGFRLEFDEPQRAVTPGQAVVLYDGEIVVGGGTVKKPSIEAEQGAQKWNADGVAVENRIAALPEAAYVKVKA